MHAEFGFTLGATLLATSLLATAVHAQSATEASRLFRAAVAAHAEGDFDAAARAFEAASDLAPSGATLFNAGVSWRSAGNESRALDSFQRAETLGGLTDPQAERVAMALAEGLPRYALLEVRGTGRILIEDRAPLAAPAVFVLPVGTHRVSLERADGTHAEREVDLHAGERAELLFTLDAPSPPVAAPPEPVEIRPSPVVPEVRPNEPPTRRYGAWRSGWTLLAGGVALGAGAIATGVRAWATRDDYLASFREDVALRDGARRLQTTTNVLAGTAAAVAIVGLAMIIHGRRAPVRVDAALRGQGAFVSVQGDY